MINLLDCMETQLPDADWLVLMMGRWCPEDEIFDKSYKFVRRKPEQYEAMFDNTNGVYDDLPPLTE